MGAVDRDLKDSSWLFQGVEAWSLLATVCESCPARQTYRCRSQQIQREPILQGLSTLERANAFCSSSDLSFVLHVGLAHSAGGRVLAWQT